MPVSETASSAETEALGYPKKKLLIKLSYQNILCRYNTCIYSQPLSVVLFLDTQPAWHQEAQRVAVLQILGLCLRIDREILIGASIMELSIFDVDEDKLLDNCLSYQLGYSPHTLHYVENGERASKLVSPSSVDRVITYYEIGLMNGVELFELIRSWNANAPVILMTDNRDDEIRDGFDGCPKKRLTMTQSLGKSRRCCFHQICTCPNPIYLPPKVLPLPVCYRKDRYSIKRSRFSYCYFSSSSVRTKNSVYKGE